jgi:hypothetical protein
MELATELILNGLRRVKDRHWPNWERAILETEESGCHRMAAMIRGVQLSDDHTEAALRMLKLLALAVNAVA